MTPSPAPMTIREAPFDRRIALERLCGDEELLAEFARSVRDEVPTAVARIRKALSAGSTEEAHLAAHNLKGMLATLEARPATALATDVEQLSKAGAAELAAQSLDRLTRELDRLLEALGNDKRIPR